MCVYNVMLISEYMTFDGCRYLRKYLMCNARGIFLYMPSGVYLVFRDFSRLMTSPQMSNAIYENILNNLFENVDFFRSYRTKNVYYKKFMIYLFYYLNILSGILLRVQLTHFIPTYVKYSGESNMKMFFQFSRYIMLMHHLPHM